MPFLLLMTLLEFKWHKHSKKCLHICFWYLILPAIFIYVFCETQIETFAKKLRWTAAITMWLLEFLRNMLPVVVVLSTLIFFCYFPFSIAVKALQFIFFIDMKMQFNQRHVLGNWMDIGASMVARWFCCALLWHEERLTAFEFWNIGNNFFVNIKKTELIL